MDREKVDDGKGGGTGRMVGKGEGRELMERKKIDEWWAWGNGRE